MKYEIDADLDTEEGRNNARRWVRKFDRLIELKERAAWAANRGRVDWNVQPVELRDPFETMGEDMTQCSDQLTPEEAARFRK